MSTVSRGFKGRRRPTADLPPGQYLVEDFPVLSAGPTPSIEEWYKVHHPVWFVWLDLG